MSQTDSTNQHHLLDSAPGEPRPAREELLGGIWSYIVGLALASALTVVSFAVASTTLVWQPSIPAALVVLAVAQMGVHIVFFLHITTGPDHINNIMALAYGVLIVLLVIVGSVWIMNNMNQNMGYGHLMTQMPEGMPKVHIVSAKATVSAAEETPLKAPISGVVEAVSCQVGLPVKASEVCATVAPQMNQEAANEDRVNLERAQSRLARDNASLSQAQANVDHSEALRARRKLSMKTLTRARAELDAARASVDRDEADIGRLQAELKSTEANIRLMNVVSPIDGMVLAQNVEVGQTVAANAEPLFVIGAGLDPIQIIATVGGGESRDTKVGDRVLINVNALPEQKFSGTVVEIRPSELNRQAGATDIIISAPNPNLLLKPGMTAQVEIFPKGVPRD